MSGEYTKENKLIWNVKFRNGFLIQQLLRLFIISNPTRLGPEEDSDKTSSKL